VPPRSIQQLLLARRARQRHRAQNPSARRRNLLVARPRNALLELRRPIARKRQVRVRIHKSRRHAPASRVDHVGIRRNPTLQFRVSPRRNNAPALNQQRAVLHDPQLAHLRTHARPRRPSHRHQLPDVDHRAYA
jgi:hypothetical protein